MNIDKQLHVIGSAILTLLFFKLKAKAIYPALAVGAAIEIIDYSNDRDDCIEDMAANITGVGLGILILKILQ